MYGAVYVLRLRPVFIHKSKKKALFLCYFYPFLLWFLNLFGSFSKITVILARNNRWLVLFSNFILMLYIILIGWLNFISPCVSLFCQIKMNPAVTPAPPASSPSPVPGSCYSMPRTPMASAFIWKASLAAPLPPAWLQLLGWGVTVPPPSLPSMLST